MLRTSEKFASRINSIELMSYLKSKSEHEISFSGTTSGFCVGIVDIVNSTSITSKLSNSKMCEYYSIFLNAMSKIAKTYDAVIIKNIGDSLLYYFPQTIDGVERQAFSDVLNCSLEMVRCRCVINQIISECKLPPLDFRVSADYGPVNITSSSRTQTADIFGPTVNLCSKINGAARPNSVIIGGDLHQIVRHFNQFNFGIVGQCVMGFKLHYPAYSVSVKNPKDDLGE
ncbi:MAG: adenylate/guanylate cyclase domain-containing protein [Nitrosotalea sp.]